MRADSRRRFSYFQVLIVQKPREVAKTSISISPPPLCFCLGWVETKYHPFLDETLLRAFTLMLRS